MQKNAKDKTVLEKHNKNKGNVKLSQQNQKILHAKKYPIEPDTIVRPSTSYFVPQNPGSHSNENRHKTTLSSTPLKSKNQKHKQRNSTPFRNPVHISPKNNRKDILISSKEPIDAFIDNLIEGEESIIQDEESRKYDRARRAFLSQCIETFKTGLWLLPGLKQLAMMER